MDLGKNSTMTESRALIVMVHYYSYIWPMRYHILAPLADPDSNPKVRKILFNYTLEYYFKELKYMVSADTFFNYPGCTIPFTVRTGESNKQLDAVIIQNNKVISFYQ